MSAPAFDRIRGPDAQFIPPRDDGAMFAQSGWLYDAGYQPIGRADGRRDVPAEAQIPAPSDRQAIDPGAADTSGSGGGAGDADPAEGDGDAPPAAPVRVPDDWRNMTWQDQRKLAHQLGFNAKAPTKQDLHAFLTEIETLQDQQDRAAAS